jgi:Putative adhesin
MSGYDTTSVRRQTESPEGIEEVRDRMQHFFRKERLCQKPTNNKYMKKLLFVFVCGLQALAAGAQSADHSPFLTKSFSRESVKQLEVGTSGGNISVYGAATGEARVEMYVQKNNGRDENLSKEEIQQRLDEQFNLTIAVEGNTLKAIAKHKDHEDNNWRRSLSISFRIYVPEGVSSQLRTSGGNISLKDLTGTEDFRTSGGNIDADHLSGKVTGVTSGGNVNISDSKNFIDLHTSGGNMDATRCEGTIVLATSGGNLHLRELKGDIHATTSGGEVDGNDIAGDLRTSTSGGNIHLDNLSCGLTASTSGGNVDVNLKAMGKYLDLSNSSGDISVVLPAGQGMDLKLTGERVHTGKLDNFSGDVDERSVAGKLNGGGIPVKVSGNGGSVHVSFR